MGIYRVPVGGKTYRVVSKRDLTIDEILDAVDARLRDRSPVIPDSAEKFLRDHPRIAQGSAFVLRTVPPIALGAAGTVLSPGFGTVAGTGAGATLGAAAAQEVELAAGLRQKRSAGTYTADVALGVLPGARIARDLGRVGKVVVAARRGATFGLAQRSLEIAVDEGRVINPREATEAAVGGAVVGTTLHGAAGLVGGVARKVRGMRRAPAPEVAPEIAPEVPPEVVAEPPAEPAVTEPAQVGDVDVPGRPNVLVDETGAVVGETTSAGFEIPADYQPTVSQPMPRDRIPGLVKRLAQSPEEEQQLLRDLEAISPEIEAQSRGLVPDAEVARAGEAFKVPGPGQAAPGTTAGEFQPGQAFSAEELATLWVAARASKDRLDALKDAARLKPGDAIALEAVEQAKRQHYRMVKIFAGGRTEAGRALRVAGGPRKPGEPPVGPIERAAKIQRAGEKLIAEGGLKRKVDPEKFLTDLVAAIDDPITAVKIIRESVRVPVGERLRNWVYFAYLSRPVTQMRNILGNGEAFVETHAGSALAIAAGEKGLTPGQLGKPLAAGARTGFMRGARKAFEMMTNGVTNEDLQDPDFLFRFLRGESPTELADLRGISLPGDPLGRRLGLAAMRGVPRSLMAVDLMFRTIGKEIRAHQRAYQIADRELRAQGLRLRPLGKAIGSSRLRRQELAAEMLGDPNEAKLVELMGKRATFQETPGAFARKLAEMPLAVRMLFLPFTRTPANLFRRGFQKLPGIGSVSAAREFKRQIRLEGIDPRSEAAQAFRSQLVGETALGYVAITPLVYMAATGMLTGQPPEETSARARFFEKGYKPNSLIVRTGDQKRAVPLAAFGPGGITASAVASAVSEFEQSGDLKRYYDRLAAAAGGAAMSLRDASFLTSIKELFDTGAGGFELKSVSRTLGRKAAGVTIPGAAQELERVVDPTVRRSLGEEGLAVGAQEMLSRAPGISAGVSPRIGTFGEIRRESTGGTLPQRVFSILTGTSVITEDPIRNELDRLQEAVGRKGRPVGVSPPSDQASFKIPGTNRRANLAGESLLAYKQALGQARGRAITELMESRRYDRMSDEQKATAVRSVARRAGSVIRKRAHGIVMRKVRGRHPEPMTVEELLP